MNNVLLALTASLIVQEIKLSTLQSGKRDAIALTLFELLKQHASDIYIYVYILHCGGEVEAAVVRFTSAETRNRSLRWNTWKIPKRWETRSRCRRARKRRLPIVSATSTGNMTVTALRKGWHRVKSIEYPILVQRELELWEGWIKPKSTTSHTQNPGNRKKTRSLALIPHCRFFNNFPHPFVLCRSEMGENFSLFHSWNQTLFMTYN